MTVLSSAVEFVNASHPADPDLHGHRPAWHQRHGGGTDPSAADEQTPLVFVTNPAQYAIKVGYQVDALDFMVKPVADDFSFAWTVPCAWSGGRPGHRYIQRPTASAWCASMTCSGVDIVARPALPPCRGAQPLQGARHHHQGCGRSLPRRASSRLPPAASSTWPSGADTGDLGGHVGRHGAVL